MSCKPGQPCREGVKRRRAISVLWLMAAIFVALSAVSFLDSRGQAVPSKIEYAGINAVDGKRVFQAYNCMGCHTIVGNGAYFAPDLTKLYDAVGPAWLEAYLPSAGMWPTEGAVGRHLRNPDISAEAGVDTIEAYLVKYPAAAERIARRGGQRALMPNLPLKQNEVSELIAFLKYTSAMNTEGWPPTSKVDGLTFSYATPMPGGEQIAATPVALTGAAPDAASAALDEVALGAELARDYGCTACHSAGSDAMAGPGWGGLHGRDVWLHDGSIVAADDDYIRRAITDPDAEIVRGYEPGIMPAFANDFDEEQLDALVAYIRSLEGNK